MTAYGALISLENTILSIPIFDGSSFYETLEPLQEILEGLDNSNKSKSRKNVNALDGRIKNTLWKFEDLLESLLSEITTRILSGSITCSDDEHRSLEEAAWEYLIPTLCDVSLKFIQKLKKMMEEYTHQVNNMPDDDDDDGEEEEATFASSAKMIGSFDEFHYLRYFLLEEQKDRPLMSCSVLGTAGLGKTTLVRKVCEDPDVESYYDCRVWIRVGRKYEINQANNVAAQLQGGERCLIVLDDVWETGVLPVIFSSLMEMKDDRFIRILITARGRNVVRCILSFVPLINEYTMLRFLNDEESKELLCHKVFGEDETCPPLLEKAATKIAKNCEGLPLLILTVARYLSSNRELDYWNDVAEERNSVFTDSCEEISKVLYPSYDYLPQHLKMAFLYMGVFPRDHDIPVSKILNLWSAEGWLLELDTYGSSEDFGSECLEELCMSYNLVLFKPRSSLWFSDDGAGTLKTCRLHSSWRHLCRAEARKNKFFHVLKRLLDASPPPEEEEEEEGDNYDEGAAIAINGQCGDGDDDAEGEEATITIKGQHEDKDDGDDYDDAEEGEETSIEIKWQREEQEEEEDDDDDDDDDDGEEEEEEEEEEETAAIAIKGQRGLCLENNLLFGLKQFCSSIKYYCASSSRFLLFYGPYHPYPTPIDAIGFKFLRELDALQLRFYTFPTQILMLFQLKYLALTCNDQLPTTISKLSKLRILIIHPHLNIIKCHAPPSLIPVEIWDMAILEHIEILGKSFRPLKSVDTCMRKLSTLKGVNADIGTLSELSKRIPNIKKLGVQVELTPYDTGSPCQILSCFDCISTLDSLETLKCSIMNPVQVLQASSPQSSLMLPHGLKKLHLSGMGFPWEYMVDAIASLPFLEVLKLQCYAFRGLKWEIHEGSFLELKYLAIEDSDLVEWKPAPGSFPKLYYLSLKHCYRLRELDWPSGFGKIELVDCNPLAFTCANKLQEKFRFKLSVFASDDYQA